jgi:hypothetical protein
MARKSSKASLKNLQTSTHKGRKVKGLGSVHNPAAARGMRASGIKADPRLVAASLGRVSSTPRGPEPGHGGTTY